MKSHEGFYTFLIILFSLLVSMNIHAQEIKGSILDSKTKEPIIGAIIKVENSTEGTVTNNLGQFNLELPSGQVILNISALSYETKIISINSNETNKLSIDLVNSNQDIEGIVVYGKSDATKLREQAYAVEIVETEAFKNLSTNGNDILSKISGVNIRQSGGLGSDFSLSLNGLSGNQVRVFLDGVPMDYFGSSLSLNNFSANLIERIEVYKGVVPVHLSSDALGGAINVVTNNQANSFVDASYSIGSFDTHIGSLNAQYRNQKSGFTTRFKSFLNKTDNNYKVPVKTLNIETGKLDKEFIAERFHDGYDSKMGWLEVGVTGKKYADQLMVGAMYSDNLKEIQQSPNAIGQALFPYGAVTSEEKKIITNLSYQKRELLNKKLSLNGYFVGVFSEKIEKDTSDYRYSWLGTKELRTDPNTGEIENRKTLFQADIKNYLGNINTDYKINDQHNIALNFSLNAFEIKGRDDYKAQNNTQFKFPSNVNKNVLGFGYTNTFLEKKLKNSVFVKQYIYDISSLETNYSGTEINKFTKNKSYTGYGLSSTYQFNKLQVKASFENATRFPEVSELFGNGLEIIPSPNLEPENSNNYNLGLIYKNLSTSKPFIFSVNGYVRDAKDFIIPRVQGLRVFHENNNNVLAKGIDLSGNYQFNESFIFSINGTYLDIRDNNEFRNRVQGLKNNLYKERLPNRPHLFGNFSASYSKADLLNSNDKFSVTANQNYVHEFYYKWRNIGAKDKRVVPSQFSSNLDFVYSFQESKYNASFGISNVFDAKLYDNFQQQKPGRAYNLKFRYFLNK